MPSPHERLSPRGGARRGYSQRLADHGTAYRRGLRHLLVRDHDAAGRPTAGRRSPCSTRGPDECPAARRPGPTGAQLEVLGGDHHHDASDRPGRRARRAAVSANVVLPAPGVATTRKLGAALSSNWASAFRCQSRSRTPSRPAAFFSPAASGSAVMRARASPGPVGKVHALCADFRLASTDRHFLSADGCDRRAPLRTTMTRSMRRPREGPAAQVRRRHAGGRPRRSDPRKTPTAAPTASARAVRRPARMIDELGRRPAPPAARPTRPLDRRAATERRRQEKDNPGGQMDAPDRRRRRRPPRRRRWWRPQGDITRVSAGLRRARLAPSPCRSAGLGATVDRGDCERARALLGTTIVAATASQSDLFDTPMPIISRRAAPVASSCTTFRT